MDEKQQKILEARINDAVVRAEQKSVPQFVGFLDSSGAATAVAIGRSQKAKFMLFGGYTSAERQYFGAFPDWCEPETKAFPITRLKVNNKSDRAFTHRDVLGALMSAGIERDTVGDIVITEKDAVVFASNGVVKHIVSHIQKIASAGVEITVDDSTKIEVTPRFSEHSGTVASLRLDCVVAELANCSRTKAAELIEGGFVAVSGLEVLKVTAEIKTCDTVSIRKIGKFAVDECDRVTKKGRIALKYRKYI